MASVTLIPNNYTNTGSYNFTTSTNASRRMSNAYNNADNTSSSARLTLASNRNSTRTSTMYLEFDKSALENIPSNATINSVTANVRYYVNNTTYVTAVSLQLHSNTAAKGSAVTTRSTTSAKYAITPGTWTRSELNNIRLYISATHNASTSTAYLYLYGADVTINYTASNVSVTGVSLNQSTASIEDGDTLQLTETVLPSNATNKNVTWSSSNTSVATVSNGLVTGISAGTAIITVTTTDGGYTATCTVTVTEAPKTTFVLATTITPGNSYVIADGNSGSVHVLTSQSAGSGYLAGVSGTVTNDVLSIKTSDVENALFDYVQFDENEPLSTTFTQNNNSVYLYIASSTGLIMNSTNTVDRYWHHTGTKLWQCKPSIGDGYTDNTSEYKNYLVWDDSNNRFDDAHLFNTGADQVVETTTIMPPMYLYTLDTGPNQTAYLKINGSWVACSKVYKKVNGSWVEQSDLSNVFDSDTIYIKV